MSALHLLLPHPAMTTACGRRWSDRNIVTTGFAPLANCKACLAKMPRALAPLKAKSRGRSGSAGDR